MTLCYYMASTVVEAERTIFNLMGQFWTSFNQKLLVNYYSTLKCKRIIKGDAFLI